MNTTTEPKEKTWEYLLCNAFEGGSNYWYFIEKFQYPKGKTRKDFEYPHLELPIKGGALTIKDMEGDQGTGEHAKAKLYRLDLKALERGWKIMHDKYPHHYADAITGQDDATTGDVFLQCCVFGDVIYG